MRWNGPARNQFPNGALGKPNLFFRSKENDILMVTNRIEGRVAASQIAAASAASIFLRSRQA